MARKSMYDVKEDDFKTSIEMDDRARDAMRKTFDVIAYDCLLNMGRDMWRSEVIEVVLDANHMETYGGDNEAAAYIIWMKHFKPTYFKKFAKDVFPYKKYGY